MTEVISFGSRALLVSPRKMRYTMPRGFSSVFEGVRTTGNSLDDPFLGSDAEEEDDPRWWWWWWW